MDSNQQTAPKTKRTNRQITRPRNKITLDTPAIESAVQRVFVVPNECNFSSGRDLEPEAVCSDDAHIAKMAAFVESRGEKSDAKQPKIVIQSIKQLLNCNSESCIFRRKEFIDFAQLNNIPALLDKFFKPEGPALSHDLLSNFNIDDVLHQFETKFAARKFKHIPFQMRDFDKVQSELATMNFAELAQTHDTFGCVLNTDYSHGKGIHWFCLFGERDPSTNSYSLEYFNSSGRPPLAEIEAWLAKQKHIIQRQTGLKVDVRDKNRIRYQDDDHSCGVYSLCYIWLRLEGVAPDWFVPKRFNDDVMLKARRQLFRHED